MSRAVAYVVGGASVAYGCWLLAGADLLPVARWLVGGLVAHDLVAVPLALLAGALVARYVPAQVRVPVQAGLFVSAAVTVAAGPLLLDPGTKPLPYGRNLALLLAAVWAAVLVVHLARRRRRGRDG